MENKLAYLFPGQGSQSVGMGKDFFEQFSAVRDVFEEGEELLQRKLTTTLFEGPAEELMQTEQSQVAIYLVSYSILQVIRKLFPRMFPEICAGHSLGEYSAITASQTISFVDALSLVAARGKAMQMACYENKGGMAAILGLDSDSIEKMIRGLGAVNVWIANFNSPGQVVISGTSDGLAIGMEKAKELGAKRVIPLKVSGAFHSGLMQSAQDEMTPLIEKASFVPGKAEVFMNVPGECVKEVTQIKQFLIQQVTSPVRWEQSIGKIDRKIDYFLEVGGKVLAGLNRKIGVNSPTLSIQKVEDLDELEKYLEKQEIKR